MIDNSAINTALDRTYLSFYQDDVQRILCKIAQGRKIIVFGANWKSVVFCGRYNIDIAYYAVKDYSEKKCGKTYDSIEIRSIYDIAYEELGTFYVIVADIDIECIISEKLLLSLGLKKWDDFCTIASLNLESLFTDDVHLHYSMPFELPGVKIFGNMDDKNVFRIVTLGGSTTDASTNCVSGASWSQHLFDILQRNSLASVVFNCGMAAYASPREFIKLCRDGLALSPDLVISYGGINDLMPDNDFFTNRHNRPWVDHWTETQARTAKNHINGKMTYGLQSGMTHAESWVKHIRMMHGVCNELDIKFAGFFQSFIGTSGELSEFEIKIKESFKHRFEPSPFWRAFSSSSYDLAATVEYTNSTAELINEIPYIFNKRHIYKDNAELLCDGCHTTDAGNHLIAQHIFKTLSQNGYFERRDMT